MAFFNNLYNDLRSLQPTQILDQQFGNVLDIQNLLQPSADSPALIRNRAGYIRTWQYAATKDDVGSTIEFDEETYQASLSVQQFDPENISVKVVGNQTIVVEGKHDEKNDTHGMVYRHFIRKYFLPKHCDMDKVEAKLSLDGVLTITASRIGPREIDDKSIPTVKIEGPAKRMDNYACLVNPEKECED